MSNNALPLPLPVLMGDSASIDAFARLRVSNPYTLFDSKQIHDKLPRRWDDTQVSGASTTSTYNTNQASTTIGVALNTAGKRVRQTFMRFNYMPGKSQLIIMTGVINATGGGTGITASIGQFDDSNGLFFRDNQGTLEVVCRSFVTGSAVDSAAPQSSWNIDKMDGSGVSGITIDPSKSQILLFDYEWLGVGRVRFGFVVNGVPHYCHEFLNSNAKTTVYMSTPNNPLRYEIENDGTGAASSLEHICCTVITEGGQEDNGVIHYKSTSGVATVAATINTLYAVIGVRLKSTHLDAVVKELTSSIVATSKGDYEWILVFNPTVAGTFTYTDNTDSSTQSALGVTANTVTGGHEITGGWALDKSPAENSLPNAIWLGSSIAGVRDELVLCVRPQSTNMNIQAGMAWRELT